MLKIREAAALSGVTVRTLQYYDRIGLLRPAAVTEAGYRLYDEAALARLQEILFFREMEFPLEEIRAILDSPGYDRAEALRRQKALLLKKRERLDKLIRLVERSSRGEDTMNFDAFDRKEIEHMQEEYAREAKERWGGTAAYRQSAERQEKRSAEENEALGAQFTALFEEFAALRDRDPAGAEAAELVGRLRDFIHTHYYDCTPDILLGLADMYEADERFRQNIDRAGEGTAVFAAAAIRACCGQ